LQALDAHEMLPIRGMVEFVQSAAYKLDVASFPTFMAIHSGPLGHKPLVA